MAVLMPTPNCLAAWLHDNPPVITAVTTRSRRSINKALPIPVLASFPASTVNQKSISFGNPNQFILSSSRSSRLLKKSGALANEA